LGGKEQLPLAGKSGPIGSYHQALDVKFSALTFRDPASVQCSYRLNGLETDYNEGAMREIRYPALPAGSYSLEVRCDGPNGISSEPARFVFSIEPAWWDQWWMWLLYIILVALIVRAAIFYRTRALEADRRHLEEAVAARSAELAAANRELQEASLTDPLTKARNRRFFTNTIDSDLGQAVRAYERASER